MAKETTETFSGKSKDQSFDVFDEKVLTWCRKQFGDNYAKGLWHNKLTLIDNLDLDLTAGNRDNIYVQYSVYYSQLVSDNTIPHLIATGASPIGLGFNLYNANPAIADANNWTGALYVYFELYTIN